MKNPFKINDAILLHNLSSLSFGVITGIVHTETREGRKLHITYLPENDGIEQTFEYEEGSAKVLLLNKFNEEPESGLKTWIMASPGYDWATKESARHAKPPAPRPPQENLDEDVPF